MEETVSVDVQSDRRPVASRRRGGLRLTNLLSFVVGLVGVAALGASAWVYVETQRDVARLSTAIAELRIGMELFGRQQGTPSGTDAASLLDLSNRLSILEETWRSGTSSATAEPATPPATALPATPDATAASDGDCLPTGTRFLVSAGDSYPVCGIAATVDIGAVDNGFISLGDGTVIAAGGNIGLPGTACMIGVVSAGEDGMTGFAEIRVTC